jgi:hypothetical protein
MSAEKRSQSSFNKEFSQVMHANYTPEEKVLLNDIAGGFTGEIGLKIAELQAEGLGRMIGIPIKKGDPSSRGAYKEAFYALPLPNKDIAAKEKSFLLIIPHDNGVDMAIVSPLRFTGRNAEKENERLTKKLEEIFSPSDEPFIFNGSWNSEPGARTLTTFVDNQKQFFAQYQLIPGDVSYEDLFDQAIQSARADKESIGEEEAA